MAVNIPEFILSGMFVKGSLTNTDKGFVFSLKNTYAPATLLGFALEIEDKSVPPENIMLTRENAKQAVSGKDMSPEKPLPLPVHTLLEIEVLGYKPGHGKLRVHAETKVKKYKPMCWNVLKNYNLP